MGKGMENKKKKSNLLLQPQTPLAHIHSPQKQVGETGRLDHTHKMQANDKLGANLQLSIQTSNVDAE